MIRAHISTMALVQRAFELELIEFLNGDGTGARLRKDEGLA
jgi:hypothetical protein